MKALVLEEYKAFSFREVSTPEAGRGEVLVRVGACGICGGDVHAMDGSTGQRHFDRGNAGAAAETVRLRFPATGPGDDQGGHL